MRIFELSENAFKYGHLFYPSVFWEIVSDFAVNDYYNKCMNIKSIIASSGRPLAESVFIKTTPASMTMTCRFQLE